MSNEGALKWCQNDQKILAKFHQLFCFKDIDQQRGRGSHDLNRTMCEGTKKKLKIDFYY